VPTSFLLEFDTHAPEIAWGHIVSDGLDFSVPYELSESGLVTEAHIEMQDGTHVAMSVGPDTLTATLPDTGIARLLVAHAVDDVLNGTDRILQLHPTGAVTTGHLAEDQEGYVAQPPHGGESGSLEGFTDNRATGYTSR
jgi:hypothetical protein